VTEEVTEKTINREDTINAAPKSHSGLWIGIIVLLIVVLIAGAGFYVYQQLRSQGDDISKEDQRNERIEKQISDFQTQLATMQSQLTDASATLTNADERFEQKMSDRAKTQEEKLETTRKDLTNAVLQIQRQLGKTRGDWLIADAEYLLSVAGQRLHLMGDVETTREALEAADQRLRESGDAAAFKVRDEIAKELTSLRSIPVIDLVGMYAKLQSLSSRVNNLTLFLPYQGKPVSKSSEHDKHPAPSKTSSDLLNVVLKQLDGYVTVRHTEQPIKAILTTEEAQFIRQQLSLKLEMIKLALVQKNQPLYQASLEDALAWLDKNFNKNAETQLFISELNQLNATKLNAQMPDISLSLKMLRDITKLRIETDKALPPVDLESKIEHPKAVAEEAKAAVVQPPPANALTSNAETAKAEVKTEKPLATTPVTAAVAPNAIPVVEKTATINTAEVKKPTETVGTQTVAPAVNKPAVVTEQKKAPEATKTVSPPAIVEPQKAVETAPKADVTPKPAEKTLQPAVTKPVVVH
jgi:uncharacterized protein HemX